MGIHPSDQMTRTVYWTQFPPHALSGTDWTDHSNAHASIMRLFPARIPGPHNGARSTAGILYRFDTHAGQPPTVLVQSLIPPELTPAQARTITVPDRAWATTSGMKVQFRVAVCPIRRHKPPKGTPGGERTIPVPADELEAWAIDKLAGALDQVQVLNVATRTTSAARTRGQRACPPRVNVATIDGIATVIDPDGLTGLRVHGVGRAKAYGAGLLTTRSFT